MKHTFFGKAGLVLWLISAFMVQARAQQTWFVDGYHGGVYGHYPQWQARFMVEKLTQIPDWNISLEIEPETWDSVSVTDAQNFKALQEYYEKEGRFGRIEFTNPTWSQPYCYNVSGESLIRHFSYGIAKIKEYFPSATFTTYAVEEPCFASGLPQILKGFNFKYAILRNPNTCWGGYTAAFGQDLVNWIGPDGTSLLAVPRYRVEELSTENCFATESANQSEAFIKACFQDGVKYPIGMCYQDAGWQHGPWLGNAIKDYYKPTTYTTWTSYIESIKGKVKPTDWHFSSEDIMPGLVWGSQVLQIIAQQVRESENNLVMAEKMASLKQLYSGEAWPKADFAEAWRTLMLSQHHDCWIVPYNNNGNKGLTWAGEVAEWTASSNAIARKNMAKLFVPVRQMRSVNILVYNTMGQERTALACLPMTLGDEMSIVDGNQKEVPSQQLDDLAGNERYYFLATAPGAGYTTYGVSRTPLSETQPAAKMLPNGNIQVETDYYMALIDASKGGAITSLIDKKHNGRQWVEDGSALNSMRGYFYEKETFVETAKQSAKISIADDGPLFTRIKVVGFLDDNPYCQMITFQKYSPLIDFELKIDWYGQPGIGAYDQRKNFKFEERAKAFYNDAYKLHLEFPLQGVGQKLYKNSPFDVTESQLKDTYYTSWDNIKHNVIVNWVDVENQAGTLGMTLLTDHTTSYLNDPELALGLTVQYIGRALWGRMYKVQGPTHMHYALLPHKGNWVKGDVEMASASWNEPLVANFTAPQEKTSHSLMSCADPNFQLTSMTMDGADLLLRFYNTSDSKKQQITLNLDADDVQIVNLLGEKQADAVIKRQDGKITVTFTLPQFRFQTLRLTNARL